ncbi:MAG: tetratricopeptide repeat protein, partial [Bacteroidota bacterium]
QDAETETRQSDCAFYIANCAIRLNQQNADDLVENFVADYPTSTKRNTAFLDVANYYFSNGKYAYARKWFEKVDEKSVSPSERDKFNFNYGYSLYETQDKPEAQKYLNRVITSDIYGAQAKYYIGYMAYEGDDYDTANTYFEQVADREKYKDKLSYYQADLNFKIGKFEEAIQLAKAQMPKASATEQSELSKIIGESYFNLEKYKEAIPYLTAYEGKQGKWNNTDYYQLGYAHYKQSDFEKAISEFNKIIDGDNAVAQNAYYHLGESYINLEKKQEALNAFRNASQMDYDLKIQEDAWLNYAKISYEIGNPYQSVPQVLSDYLDKYPKTNYRDEIESLLIDSYITSKNYKEALKLLEGKSGFENRVAYQKVAFFRGIELYNDSEYQEARTLFEKSVKESKVPLFTTRAIFWQAEADYILNNFEEALIGYKQFLQEDVSEETEEYKNINYNLGYTYFKMKNYDQATGYFEAFINDNKEDKLRINDALLRLGDGHFVSSNYNSAIASYQKAIAINEIESDYATFQKAMSYGYIGKGDIKMTQLRAFIDKYPKSGLRDDAMYELANSYVKSMQTDKAMTMYNRLISDYPKSMFISKALLRQGLSYYNSNNNDVALNKFKTIAKNYPSSPEANQAVATSRLIYIDLGRVDDYARWVKTLDFVEVTNVDLDNTAYLAAEKQYLDTNTDEAIKQFNKYLNNFPNGIHALQSHYYLAEMYAMKDLTENAKPHFKYVTEAPKNEFTEQSIVKLSEIYLNDSKWDEAIPLLRRLESEADYPQNKIYAQSNLMNAYYQKDNYTEAVDYAEKTLKNSKIDNKLQSDAQLIIARSAIKTDNEVKAKQAYLELGKIATGALAAESLYFKAYFENQERNFEASNSIIQKLAKDYSSYKYYSAKGLVLMAKNFYALEDAFQATYILESVIGNFSEFVDVVSEAQTELDKIKAEQAKTNSSIDNQND